MPEWWRWNHVGLPLGRLWDRFAIAIGLHEPVGVLTAG